MSLKRSRLLGISDKISNFGIYLLAGSRSQAFRLRPMRALRAKTAIAKNGLNGTTLWFSGSSLKPVQSILAEDGRFTLKAGCGRENLRAKTAAASASVRRSWRSGSSSSDPGPRRRPEAKPRNLRRAKRFHSKNVTRPASDGRGPWNSADDGGRTKKAR